MCKTCSLAILILLFIHTCIANVPTPPDPPRIKILRGRGKAHVHDECVNNVFDTIVGQTLPH